MRVESATLDRLARTGLLPEDAALLRDGIHVRRLVQLRALADGLARRAESVPAAVRERFDRHWSLIEEAEAANPDAVREVLGYPFTGSWLVRCLSTLEAAPDVTHVEYFGSVAMAAALLAGVNFSLERPSHAGTLPLPGLGRARLGSPWLRITAGRRTVRVTAAGRPPLVLLRHAGRPRSADPRWQALRLLPGGLVPLDDLDPYRAPERGIGPCSIPASNRAGAAEAGQWRGRWTAALDFLQAADPGRVAELRRLLVCVVPLGGPGPFRPADPRVSCTLRAAPGAVLTTRQSGARRMAEVLVHEVHHTKLGTLMNLVPLHFAGPEALYQVPWRSDPRPFEGVLQGIYAHLAMADFWLTACRSPALTGAERDAARVRHEYCCRLVAQALPIIRESSQLTFAGREFAAKMAEHHASLAGSPGVTPR